MISNLTNREKQLIDLICGEDLSYKEVGARLGISRGTVKGHVQHILAKMNAITMRGVCARFSEIVRYGPSIDAIRAYEV